MRTTTPAAQSTNTADANPFLGGCNLVITNETPCPTRGKSTSRSMNTMHSCKTVKDSETFRALIKALGLIGNRHRDAQRMAPRYYSRTAQRIQVDGRETKHVQKIR